MGTPSHEHATRDTRPWCRGFDAVTFVTLSIEQAHERIRLTIVDDGVGLERPTGRGLSVLARRVERLGGRSEISRAEAATRLVVELPFHEPSR